MVALFGERLRHFVLRDRRGALGILGAGARFEQLFLGVSSCRRALAVPVLHAACGDLDLLGPFAGAALFGFEPFGFGTRALRVNATLGFARPRARRPTLRVLRSCVKIASSPARDCANAACRRQLPLARSSISAR